MMYVYIYHSCTQKEYKELKIFPDGSQVFSYIT